MAQKFIRGYPVFYESNAIKGIEHLAYVLTYEETDSLFRSARLSGKVEFEDRVGRNFTLINTSGRNFQVKKR